MRFVSSILLLLIFISCKNVNNLPYQIIGSIEAPTDSIIYLNYKYNDSTYIDSSKIINERFMFSGNVLEPINANLIYEGGIPSNILLDKATINIDLSRGKNYSKSSISSNSKRVNLVNLFSEYRNSNQQLSDSIIMNLGNLDINKQYYLNLVEEWLHYTEPAIEIQKKIESKINSAQIDSSNLTTLNAYFERNKQNQIGTKIPQLKFPDINDDLTPIFSRKNKYTIIDFWASWCHPCILTNEYLSYYKKDLQKLGIEITSVSIDEKLNPWIKANSKQNINWNSVIDSTQSTMNKFKYFGIPYAILVDEKGFIVKSNLKNKDIEKIALRKVHLN